jgi:hypothetical protein
MLNKIKGEIETNSQLIKQKKEEISLRFNHPIANGTSWNPLRGGGANFQTQKLSLTADNQLKVVKSRSGKAFYLLFAGIGSFVMLLGIFLTLEALQADIRNDGDDNLSGIISMIPFGLIFFLVGFIPLYYSRKLNFDKSSGICYFGKTHPKDVFRNRKSIKYFRMDEIKGLQILAEYVQSSEDNYYSYELNLILDNFERINVMDHGNLNTLREDAQMLSKYLDVPVFDATL